MLKKNSVLFLSLMIVLVLPMQTHTYGNANRELPEWAVNLYGIGSQICNVGATIACLAGYVAQGTGYAANKTLGFVNHHPFVTTGMGITAYVAWKQRNNIREHGPQLIDQMNSWYMRSLSDIFYHQNDEIL